MDAQKQQIRKIEVLQKVEDDETPSGGHPITSLQARVSFLTGVKTHSSVIHPAERVSSHDSIKSARRRISDALLDAGVQLRSVPKAQSPSNRVLNPWCLWSPQDRLYRWKHAGVGQL
jgi:hypothetical protein